MDPAEVGSSLEPLLAGDLPRWRGLPDLEVQDLEAYLGRAMSVGSAKVGAYPAQRLEFRSVEADRILVAFARGQRVFMVEVLPPPGTDALTGLPEPTAILPQEIAVEGAYAHEVLYAERGLLLTMAQAFDERASTRLVRCRGIRPLIGRGELGSELYMPLETEVKW